jgi:hypothetical protein
MELPRLLATVAALNLAVSPSTETRGWIQRMFEVITRPWLSLVAGLRAGPGAAAGSGAVDAELPIDLLGDPIPVFNGSMNMVIKTARPLVDARRFSHVIKVAYFFRQTTHEGLGVVPFRPRLWQHRRCALGVVLLGHRCATKCAAATTLELEARGRSLYAQA